MIYPDIDPVMLRLGPVQLHWYGMMYLLGFAAAWALGRLRASKPDSTWTTKQIDDLLFYCALGVVLGGRLGYILFYSFDSWMRDPLQLLRVWEGGMSFHGGFIGVALGILLFARREKLPFFKITDFVAPLVTIGLFAGRIGNFINGELWGRPTDLPWAMQVRCGEFASLCRDKLGLPAGTELTPPLHPSQLYEALFEGLVLFLILWLYSSRPRPMMAVTGLFLFFYGIFRFGVELLRMPDAHIGYLAGGWFTMGQLLTVPMILIGAVFFIIAYRNHYETVS